MLTWRLKLSVFVCSISQCYELTGKTRGAKNTILWKPAVLDFDMNHFCDGLEAQQ